MVGTGIVAAGLAARFAAGGYVGRAAGRGFDARAVPGYAPYAGLGLSVPVLHEGDVDARAVSAWREIDESLPLIGQLLDGLPTGDWRAADASAAARASGWSKRSAASAAMAALDVAGCFDRSFCAIVLAAMAAAGSGHRGQHRRRLPAV